MSHDVRRGDGYIPRWLAWYLSRRQPEFLDVVVISRLRPALVIAWPAVRGLEQRRTPPLSFLIFAGLCYASGSHVVRGDLFRTWWRKHVHGELRSLRFGPMSNNVDVHAHSTITVCHQWVRVKSHMYTSIDFSSRERQPTTGEFTMRFGKCLTTAIETDMLHACCD